MRDEMAKKTTGIKVLGWIIIFFFLNEFIPYAVFVYFGIGQRNLPDFLEADAMTSIYFSPTFSLYKVFAKYNLPVLSNILSMLPLICSILFIASAIGLLRYKNWARKLIIDSLCFLFIFTLIPFCYDFEEIIRIAKAFPLILYLYVFKAILLLCPIIYLTRPKVREQFK